jgi:uncharacterized membrane protein
VRWVAVALVVACFALQIAAYRASALTATHPAHCIASPFGTCHEVMASGYADVLAFRGARWNVEEAVAMLVTLVMWLAAIGAIHNPRLRSRAAVGYAIALAVLLAWSATHLRNQPSPEPVPMRPT